MSNDGVSDGVPNDGVRCMLMRGGTSKGAYFLADDLPADPTARDDVLLRIMGSPDERQIDGLGGAHPLTSKVAVVRPSTRPDADVDYLFLQVSVDEPLVSDRQNCGNLLAGIGPFAVERGLVVPDPGASTASVRVFMVNTDSIATATFPVAAGVPVYEGRTAIDGVPGVAAAIELDFDDIAGGSCGALLPTGNVVDVIDGTEVTLIDNGMPVVVMRAADVGIEGTESPAELESDTSLRRRLESIRLQAGPLMQLGDVTDTTVPKLTMVSAPTAGGDISTRTFIPHRCHEAIGVLGAVSVATAALLPGAPAAEMLRPGAGADGTVTCEHPTGVFTTTVDVDTSGDIPRVRRAGIVRTARKLMDGTVYPRSTVWPPNRSG
jgi:4-oxalomesaconate tautomerase